MNKEQLKIILNDHKIWLDMGGVGGIKADLTGADLTGANLREADLSRADLSRADLEGADLTGADLYRANLRGADLTGANLKGADLSGADLIGANLIGANLTEADLSGADLTGADLTGADLYRVNLEEANLRDANLEGPSPEKQSKPIINKMEFNQNYITEQIKRYIEVFNEDIAAKERELSNLNNAVSALENIHRTLKDANFQNDMASVCERIGKEKTIKEKELEEFRKSIRIEFRIDKLIPEETIQIPNDPRNPEGVIGNHDIFTQLQGICNA